MKKKGCGSIFEKSHMFFTGVTLCVKEELIQFPV